jgi:hypothetical protein
LLDSLKALLGVEFFGKYFADSNDESETRLASAVELLHYLDTLFNNHLTNKTAYQDKAERHIFNLLGKFTTSSLPLPNVGFFL